MKKANKIKNAANIVFDLSDIIRKDFRSKSNDIVTDVARQLGEVIGSTGGDLEVNSAKTINGSVLNIKTNIRVDQAKKFEQEVGDTVKSTVRKSITDWSDMKKPE
jgi:hypothetical protein